MNISHTTLKDKEIPRWRPLQRMPRVALAKLSPKRIIVILLFFMILLFFYHSSLLHRRTAYNPKKEDDDVLSALRKELKSKVRSPNELVRGRSTAVFVTAHTLYNASAFTTIACEMAHARKMNVLMMFVGANSTNTVPFLLHANRFEKTTCPMVWHDARNEYSSIDKQAAAMELLLADVMDYLYPPIVVYVDDEPDWFMQSLERVVFWRQPAISLIQLKRRALVNLHWIASLSPSALEGRFFWFDANSSVEYPSD